MFELIDLYTKYLSKQREISNTDSTAKVTSNTNVMPNIDDEKFLKMKKFLKLSFKILSFPLNMEGNFVSKENEKEFKKLEEKIWDMFSKTKENQKKIIDIKFDYNIVLALASYNLGKVYIKIAKLKSDSDRATKEEVNFVYTSAYSYFKSCIELLTGKELDRNVILIIMKVYDEIYYILTKHCSSKIKDQKDCYSHLLRSFNTYIDYTQNNKYPCPVDIATLFGIDDTEDKENLDTKVSLDNLHIENLKRLSILYNNNSNDKNEYVAHMHVLLNTLLENVFLFKKYREWAMAATQLSRYFVQHKRFTEARNYLAAASYMMEKDKTEHFATTTEKTAISNKQSLTEKFKSDLLDDQHQYQCAKIAKLWGQYGLQLLSASKENLLKNIPNQSCKADNLEHSDSTKSNEESNKESQEMLIFTSLEDELKDITTKIPDKYLLNFHDFKIVFEKVLEWFNTAIKYFTVEKDIKSYGEIILQMSLAYKYFADFERHQDKLKIYEQQEIFLRNALEKISDNTAVISKGIKRLMLLEVSINYATILNITIHDEVGMYKKIPNQEILLKMKNSIQKNLDLFEKYLESFL